MMRNIIRKRGVRCGPEAAGAGIRWLVLISLQVWVLVTSPTAHALTIIPTFDSTVTSNPNATAVESDVQMAVNFYETTFTAPITVLIKFGIGAGTYGAGLGGMSFPSTFQSDFNTIYKPALLASDA